MSNDTKTVTVEWPEGEEIKGKEVRRRLVTWFTLFLLLKDDNCNALLSYFRSTLSKYFA